MHIVGTAGHVDHGKSSLVTALTGTNPDRLLEEQVRGMTLDLGFAHLRFDDGVEAGIVDVPGHERFLHNMLAGAAGMEVLLLVVAADDGVMPQTREHLQILRHLNVKHTIVALTKSDLVASAELDATLARVREQLRDTIAGDAPMVALSNVTGAGLDRLRSLLHDALVQLAPHDPDAPAYMPVDRVFTLPGRGTIVTGTLMQGRITAGEAVAIAPLGESHRVRSLHVFGQARASATGGTRVALNLPGVDRARIARGAAIVDPSFPARSEFAVRFEALPEAQPLLRRRTPVRAYIGSAEVLGTLLFAESVTLVLREPVPAFPGVRFVVRRVSPKTLLGGGEILASAGEASLRDAGTDAAIAALLARNGVQPLTVSEIAYAVNLREESVQRELDELIERGEAVAVARPAAYLGAEAFAQFGGRVASELALLHEAQPWAVGATSMLLARALGIEEPLLLRLLGALAEEGRIVQRHGYFAATDHQPKLSAEQRAFFESSVPLDAAAPFLPVPFAEVAERARGSQIVGLNKAFDTLLARGVLVKVGDALYRGTQIERAHERIDAFIAVHGKMTMAEFRDLLGTSRKYAVPLLEWFDARGITVRSGDFRMLRARRGAREQSV
ncbi:MAG TPA: selenocysteine-specific translation elongation factor [Candidatus Acidoferrales bacterium]|nr:selenocysteine-specific translation elongation factor [Candidatus Acidoferrales bacterium]